MNYQFPYIEYIDTVMGAIEDREEFTLTEKDGYSVIKYNFIQEDTFPDVIEHIMVPINPAMSDLKPSYNLEAAIRRECRGIIFDSRTGQIIRRPYHKFFNYKERAETQKIDLSQPHSIPIKEDGSMIAPFIVDGELLWGTKSGVTDVSNQVLDHLNNFYINFARKCITQYNSTPIFEWCSRKQRIILDYPEDRLILTGIRHMKTGIYMKMDDMEEEAKLFHIPYVDSFSANTHDMNAIEKYIHDQEGVEGFIVRFEDGHMVKCKSHWYLQLHKTKEAINQDRNIVELIIFNRLDDLKPNLTEEDRLRLTKFESDINDRIYQYAKTSAKFVQAAKEADLTRKDFASKIENEFHPLTKRLCSKLWDNPSLENAHNNVKSIIVSNLTKTSSYEIIRDTWLGGLKFNGEEECAQYQQ